MPPTTRTIAQERADLIASAALLARERGVKSLFGPASTFWKRLDAGWPLETAGQVYEAILEQSEKKASGSYFTPPVLVESLLERVLLPIIPATSEGILSFRICDPACGTGHFLIPAARKLAERLSHASGVNLETALNSVVSHCIVGIDIDPIAVGLCKRALLSLAPQADVANIRCADSLSSCPPHFSHTAKQANAWCRVNAPQAKSFFHWHLEFPEGFDLVLGNPPFLNAIERKEKGPIDGLVRKAFPQLGGTADRSFYFLALASRICKPTGWVGMVLPRTVLNAPAVDELRRSLNLRYLCVPQKADLFTGAAVFVCLVGVGPPGLCQVDAALGATNKWELKIESSNWWQAIQSAPIRATGTRVADQFEVTASMTAGDAYDCLPNVVDSQNGPGPKLLTTGLIEPEQSLWGTQDCRYLKHKFQHPRLQPSSTTRSIQKRIARAKRPKIVVAGLSKSIECLLDEVGEYIGAVSTYSIYHPKDDIEALRRLCQHLLRTETTTAFHDELGANAMGGGSITMKRTFLEDLPFA